MAVAANVPPTSNVSEHVPVQDLPAAGPAGPDIPALATAHYLPHGAFYESLLRNGVKVYEFAFESFVDSPHFFTNISQL